MDSLLNLVPIGLGVPIGCGDDGLYALLQLDSVLKSPIRWLSWQYLPKYHSIPVKEGLYLWVYGLPSQAYL